MSHIDDRIRGPSASIRPFQKPGIKRREDDPVIAMARDRQKKGLQIEKQRMAMSGASGAVLTKILELKKLDADIKGLEDGVQEYQNQASLPRPRHSRCRVGQWPAAHTRAHRRPEPKPRGLGRLRCPDHP